VTDFDSAAELDEFKKLRERILGDNMIIDTIDYMDKTIKDPKKRIVAEGANACMLDVDFGTFPYVTSSNTTIGGVCTGLGVPPQAV